MLGAGNLYLFLLSSREIFFCVLFQVNIIKKDCCGLLCIAISIVVVHYV